MNTTTDNRTISDLISEVVVDDGLGDETREYQLIPIAEMLSQFKETDVTLLLSWAGGLLLSGALDKIEKGIEDDLDEDEIEGLLTEKEKAMIYGAYLMSESSGEVSYE
jgi:hypothetical protein